MARWTAACLVVMAGSFCVEARRELLTTVPGAECSGACAAQYEKCGGKGFATPVACCNPAHSCVKKNAYYAQCMDDETAQAMVEGRGWDGAVLTCAGGAGGLNCGGACVPRFDKCGGRGLPVAAGCCNPEDSCVRKNAYYAQCLSAERAEWYVATADWDGEVLVAACAGAASGGEYGNESPGGYYGGMANDLRWYDSDAVDSRAADEELFEQDKNDLQQLLEDLSQGDGGEMLSDDSAAGGENTDDIFDIDGGVGGSIDGSAGPTAARSQGETHSEDVDTKEIQTSSAGLVIGLVAAAAVAAVVIAGVAFKMTSRAAAASAGGFSTSS